MRPTSIHSVKEGNIRYSDIVSMVRYSDNICQFIHRNQCEGCGERHDNGAANESVPM